MSDKKKCLEWENFKSLLKRNIRLIQFAGGLIVLSGFFHKEIFDKIVNPIDLYLYNNTSWGSFLLIFIGFVILLIVDLFSIKRYSRKEFKITYLVGFIGGGFFLFSRLMGCYIFDKHGIYIKPLNINLTFLDAIAIILLIHLYFKFIYELAKSITRSDKIEYTFLSDVPPDDVKYDELGMKNLILGVETIFDTSYPKAFTIGINASWGKGKSTFVNFLKKEIERKKPNQFIFFDFNPYEILNDKSIEISFFEELKRKFALYDRNISNKINHYINDYVKEKKGIVSSLYGMLNKDTSIDDISECLKAADKKLVIIIDDIDRLIRIEDFIATFQLVRNINPFQKTYIIVCYDKKNVQQALINNKIDPSYLDKIINYEHRLPPIDGRTYFASYLQTSLSQILKKAFEITDEDEINRLNNELETLCFLDTDSSTKTFKYLKGTNSIIDFVRDGKLEISLADYFSSIRDLKRFLISFSIKYVSLKDRVDVLDYFLFHLFRHNDQEYDKIENLLLGIMNRKNPNNYKSSYFNFKEHWALINNKTSGQPYDGLLFKLEGAKEPIEVKKLCDELMETHHIDYEKFKLNYSIKPIYLVLIKLLFLEKNNNPFQNFRSLGNAPYYIYENYPEFEIHDNEALNILDNIELKNKFKAPKIRNLIRWLISNNIKITTEDASLNALRILIEHTDSSQYITSTWEYYYRKMSSKYSLQDLSLFILPIDTETLILDVQIIRFFLSLDISKEDRSLLTEKLKLHFKDFGSTGSEYDNLLAWYGIKDSLNNVTEAVNKITKEKDAYQIGNRILGPDPAPGIIKDLNILYRHENEIVLFHATEHNFIFRENNQLTEISNQDIATLLKDLIPTTPFEDKLSGQRQWIHEKYCLAHDFRLKNHQIAVDCKLEGTQWEIVVHSRIEDRVEFVHGPIYDALSKAGYGVQILPNKRVLVGIYYGEAGLKEVRKFLIDILRIVTNA